MPAQEAAEAASLSKPNILVFIADDMAADDCGAYGHTRIRTPNIDSLAREGMKFTRARFLLAARAASAAQAS